MSRRNHEQIQQSSEEAEEVQEEIDPDPPSSHPASESEGEDLIEDASKDYHPIDELDHYEDQGVDSQQFDLNPEARREAEKQMAKRQKLMCQEEVEVEDLIQDEEMRRQRQERQIIYKEPDDFQEEQFAHYIDAQKQKGPFERWINIEAVRRYIKHYFKKILDGFTENGAVVYPPMIKQMVMENRQTLAVQYSHINDTNKILSKWLCFHPIQLIPELNAALYAYICRQYPNYSYIATECFVRIFGLPVLDSIRQLSHQHLGQLVKIRGVVTSRSDLYSQLKRVFYKCYRCGAQKGPYFVNENCKLSLGSCYSCQSSGPFVLDKQKTVYRNYQTINIQQSPSEVQPGRIPRSKQAILYGDIIDKAKPGDELQIIGVFVPRYECSLNIKTGFPVFKTLIEANFIKVFQEVSQYAQIDVDKFEKLPKMQKFAERFYNSIAPSIYGHKKVKRALSFAIFGGIQKRPAVNHRTRGDINILLLGDPGIAKSQFLKSIQRVFPRCVYTTGKGASAVGLTACVKADPQTGEWKLQAGALVIADRGICLIDQFDKMSQADRTSIHEAMEQQTISISKAGIVATLNARCSVIAAANPLSGRYNQRLSFRDNVSLTDPILSRFDILNVIKDKIDEQIDSKLSSFVLNQHMKSHPYLDQYNIIAEQIDQQPSEKLVLDFPLEFLKQYIKYAREKYSPKLTEMSSSIIRQFYVKLREYSIEAGGISIATRHLESMIRICEANARMHLRKETNEKDARLAIAVMLESFTDSQKHSTAESIRKKFWLWTNPDL